MKNIFKKNLMNTEKDRISSLEKDVNRLKKFYQKCNYKNVIERYHTLHSNILTLVSIVVGIVTLFVTIPTVYNVVTYNNQIKDLENLTQTYKYLLLAERSYSANESIKYYTSAIEHDKDNSELYFLRARTYYENGEFELALSDCNTAIKKDDSYTDLYYLRARIYFELNQHQMAINDFLMYVPINEEDTYNIYIGYSYYSIKDYENALIYFNKTPDSILARDIIGGSKKRNLHYLMFNCYMELKDYPNATNSLAGLLDDYSSEEDIHFVVEQLNEIYKKSNDANSIEFLENLLSEMYTEIENNEQSRERRLTISKPNYENLSKYELLYRELENRIYGNEVQ